MTVDMRTPFREEDSTLTAAEHSEYTIARSDPRRHDADQVPSRSLSSDL